MSHGGQVASAGRVSCCRKTIEPGRTRLAMRQRLRYRGGNDGALRRCNPVVFHAYNLDKSRGAADVDWPTSFG